MEPLIQEEEEYSSYDEYEDEQQVPGQHQPQQRDWGSPFGSTVIRTHKTKGTKKKRIKRSGTLSLNMTRNYGLKSGWGKQEGFRELIQNLSSPSLFPHAIA